MKKGIESTDFAVIGSGASGMAAALTAAEGGADVIIFEKMRNLGGVSNFAEGMFAVESEMQRAQYVSYNRDDAFKTIMEYSHWRANPRLVRSFVNESGATIAWLLEQGVEFEEVTTNVPGGPLVWHILKGSHRERASTMMKTLAARAKEKGVDFRLATPVRELVKRDSTVTGVIVEMDGETVQVDAKAVMIATGGYANHKEWIRKYAGLDLGVDLTPIGNVDKMGDGIRMAWQAGAAEEGMGVLQLLKGGPVLGPGLNFIGPLESAACQPGLWVNKDGERYCDESIQGNFAFDGNAMVRQKDKTVFALFNDAMVQHWKENGTDLGTGRIIPPGSRIDVGEELNEALGKKASDIYAADSIEDLGAMIGMEPSRLKFTVDEYNGFCEKGHDDLFAKDPRYLRPLKEPRFYALKCNAVFLGTLGGIKINHKMEVVDKNDNPIPGLYAGGMDAGGLYGDSYDVITCGGTLAFALNSGRMAGKNASVYMGSSS
jgi:fumarate reductase flavoprotein subunit